MPAARSQKSSKKVTPAEAASSRGPARYRVRRTLPPIFRTQDLTILYTVPEASEPQAPAPAPADDASTSTITDTAPGPSRYQVRRTLPPVFRTQDPTILYTVQETSEPQAPAPAPADDVSPDREHSDPSTSTIPDNAPPSRTEHPHTPVAPNTPFSGSKVPKPMAKARSLGPDDLAKRGACEAARNLSANKADDWTGRREGNTYVLTLRQ
ncbi:hypothetical protein B0H15DRAFT_991120 [Mycena belliarum]|uniref:Uncharacterized protein n=1 Tax=Mycena belliarum TaxID=1033014 RepID=A0AAD6UF29_9AGAR|nr:hypothetical protein B0H15DRAFT_991120 [Mycena belliae]